MKFAFTLLISILCTAGSLVAKVRMTVEETLPLATQGAIVLTNGQGSIEIVGWDRNEVQIVASKWAENEEELAHIHVQIDAAADRIEINTGYEKRGRLIFKRNPNGGVDYTIKVPANANLESIVSEEGNVSVQGVRGAVNIVSNSGFTRVTGLASSASVDAGNGAIIAAFDHVQSSAEIKLKTSGACELTLPPDAAVNIDARAANATVRCGLPVEVTRERSNSLEGTLRGGGAALEIRTTRGAITIQ